MIEARRKGQTAKQIAVERAYRAQTGQARPYYLIATDLYREYPSQTTVRDLIQERYGVAVSDKTAGAWVNRGLAELTTAAPQTA